MWDSLDKDAACVVVVALLGLCYAAAALCVCGVCVRESCRIQDGATTNDDAVSSNPVDQIHKDQGPTGTHYQSTFTSL